MICVFFVDVVFQFTTSQGGRQYSNSECSFSADLSIHDLTRRSTGYRLHNLSEVASFNSRPHKEVDRNS